MVRLSAPSGPAAEGGLSRPAAEPGRSAYRLRVSGVVQGVGFRPFVHRLAVRHGLGGWVRNASGDVQIAVEGDPAELNRFLEAIRSEAPPLARIETIEAQAEEPAGRSEFVIEASAEEPGRRQPVPPDIAICPACERELMDPANRRHRYPFITCTDCGPRFSVIDGLPYDRERTTMRAFPQCPDCHREYHSPGDRRHHSETNSCPRCGPRLWVEPAEQGGRGAAEQDAREQALARAARVLDVGGIVAIRGFGGFHLACDATNETAVATLRRRKRREAKPLAVMVRDLAAARRLAEISDEEARVLTSPERPIVLLPARIGSPLAPGIAPGLGSVGLLLPSTPIHHLLLDRLDRPLVMTSGNLSEEPIATGNDEARARLSGIADLFLLHDREILSRVDDSVLRFASGRPVFLRRARGFAPVPLRLPVAARRPLLATGPHLKHTFTLVHGDHAYVSPHIGDLENLETLESFQRMLEVYRRLFNIEPAAVAHDMHPGYLSTRVALEAGLPTTVAVQHHHAHIAAVLAEHGHTGPAIGVAYDGTGYGDDGQVWGAEILLADLAGYRRLAHFRYVPLPGGDLAVRRIWRVALGYCALNPTARPALAAAFGGVDPQEITLAEAQLGAGLNAPRASSMGRLFDAAAAILGVRRVVEFEGQAAMELEALAGRRPAAEYPSAIRDDGAGGWEIDPLPMLVALGVRRQRGGDRADLAADFHASVAWATADVLRRAVEATGVTTIALGGGTFQNARLLWSLRHRLEGRGLRVLAPVALPPNDGGISFGQAAVAAARLAL